jgi:ribosomal-protein-alanine acetyltransferase
MSFLSFSTATVDLMRTEDLPVVMDIERRSNSHPWTERNFHDALSSGYLCITAREQAQIIGFAVARLLLDEAELLLIAVAPEQRRQGVAMLLWNELARRLYASGAKVVHLEVRASNQGAQAFYASLGFAQTGLRRKYYPSGAHDGEREDAWLMQIGLTA